MSCECGADWARWAASLNKFVTEYGKIIETCPDGKRRFPFHLSVIVIDNLNGSGADCAENEERRDEDKRTSMTKFLYNVVQQAAITELMDFIDCFRSAVYCQTVPARHWGMTEEVDQIADYVREKARKSNIATLDATQFWTSIKPFMGPASLKVKFSDNAGVTEGDENVVHWHHYGTGKTKALPYHWDRYLFRLACYLETCLIHEPVKKKIFDMTVTGKLSDNIKSEAKAYQLALEDQGRTTSEIAESIHPKSKSYRDAASPTPRRKPAGTVKVQQGEDAGASQASGSGLVRGENAGASQASGSGLVRDENAGASQAPGSDGALGENAGDSAHDSEEEVASSDEVAKRVENIMKFVSDVYTTDDSKMFKKGDQPFILLPWAPDQNTAKCAFCERTHEVVRPEGSGGRLTFWLWRNPVDSGRSRHVDLRPSLDNGHHRHCQRGDEAQPRGS